MPCCSAWESKPCKLCVAVSACVVLIVSVTLFACSFSTLNPHEMGLDYNGVKYKLDTTTQFNGRHFLGLGHRFVKFPRNLQYVEFSDSSDGGADNQVLRVWSRDGQEIRLSVGFYYRLHEDRIHDLFYRHGEDAYLEVIEDMAANVFREVTTQFNTIEFFENRTIIDATMRTTLQNRLSANAFADVPRFNLLDIDVPARFDAAVIDKVITQQEATTLQFLQQAATIEALSRVTVANAEQDIAVLRATVEANATVLVAQARAESFRRVNSAKANALRSLSVDLGFVSNPTPPEVVASAPLLKYLYLDVIKASATGELSIDIPTALFSKD